MSALRPKAAATLGGGRVGFGPIAGILCLEIRVGISPAHLRSGLSAKFKNAYHSPKFEVYPRNVTTYERELVSMRAIVKILVTAATIGLCAAPLQAAAANDACPFGYNPSGYSYACLNDHGLRHCGCWPNDALPACPRGTQLTCRYGLFGNRYCACD